MWPDRVSNPGPLALKSEAHIALNIILSISCNDCNTIENDVKAPGHPSIHSYTGLPLIIHLKIS